MVHIPVLLKESIDLLDLHEGDIYLDATLGEGGHAAEVWNRFSGWGKEVVIAGIDADPKSVEVTGERLRALGAKPKFANLNFREIAKAPELLDIGQPTKILFDLGWNKAQFEEGERGFSFQKDEPLLMTFGEPTSAAFTASDIVNTWEEENIETILDAYGEEKFARKIARAIVAARESGKIKTSGQLAEIVKNAVPGWYRTRKIHPATKTFQALRIAVNDELRALEEGLQEAFEILSPGGRVAVISFHSLEDRIVKKFFRSLGDSEKAEILTKRPVIASVEEIKENPRARSAKLRAILKK